MNYEDLLLEKKDGIATITLNAPEKLNALTAKMRMNLPLAGDEIDKDDDIRVVIVTGAGRGFCSGVDLAGARAEAPRYDRLQVLGWPHADVFPKLGKPVIAAINGVCVGGGLALALSCDIRIASETARFGAVWIARALVPDYGATHFLPRTVGMSKALELMYTGEIISAAEAEKIGLVSHVVPPDQLIKVASELAAKIAKQPPLSVELTKKMVWRGLFDSLNRQLDLETWAQRICTQSEDSKEAIRAFFEKRPPAPFKGK
ncbi:MAG: enoyl-CoA hydratase/isomerase family protein [Dehalococcoidales bacterium]|nr:enoyl-CoA hydratase/isomerase family protein [Dehalococcoidales bacterium]